MILALKVIPAKDLVPGMFLASSKSYERTGMHEILCVEQRTQADKGMDEQTVAVTLKDMTRRRTYKSSALVIVGVREETEG